MNRRGLLLLMLLLRAQLFTSATAATGIHYSLLINEFLADPDPSVGLPAYSYIEVKNVSASPVSLQGWGIGNGRTTAVVKEELLLMPDSLLVFFPTAAGELISRFDHALPLKGFPALSHVAGQVILSDAEGEVIDAVAYDRESFNDPVKAEGGWSLERIDAGKPCLGKANWTASADPSGGTPGRVNSVNAVTSLPATADDAGAGFLRSYCPDSSHVLLLLDGPVDAGPVSDPAHYRFSPVGPQIEKTEAKPPFFDQLLITLTQPLDRNRIYEVTVSGLSSCGLSLPDAILRTGLAAAPDSGDLLFNEILFNPPPLGADYIELYHAGKSIIDLQDCQLASRDAGGKIKDPRAVTGGGWLLFPGDYLVVTEDRSWVQSHYLVKSPDQLLELAALPSMPDDKGRIVLLNRSGKPIDELSYDHQWHSPLIADESGVALEKTGLLLSSENRSNWTSAAYTAGFGTPTYANSESNAAGYDSSRSVVKTEPAVFSPDNDGYNDFCFVTVRPGSAGFTASISIYDRNGMNIRTLAAGATLGPEGRFRWDGSSDTGQPLASGPYVLFTQIFSLQGTVRQFKNVVVLARNRQR